MGRGCRRGLAMGIQQRCDIDTVVAACHLRRTHLELLAVLPPLGKRLDLRFQLSDDQRGPPVQLHLRESSVGVWDKHVCV